MEINTKGMTEAQLEQFYEMSGKYIDSGYTQDEADRRAFFQLFSLDSEDADEGA